MDIWIDHPFRKSRIRSGKARSVCSWYSVANENSDLKFRKGLSSSNIQPESESLYVAEVKILGLLNFFHIGFVSPQILGCYHNKGRYSIDYTGSQHWNFQDWMWGMNRTLIHFYFFLYDILKFNRNIFFLRILFSFVWNGIRII